MTLGVAMSRLVAPVLVSATALAGVVFFGPTGPALAAGGVKVCVPKREGSAVLTPRHGRCKKGFKLTALGAEGKEGTGGKEGKPGAEGKAGSAGFSSSELEALRGLLAHAKFVAVGIGGKPTVQFSGVNVQIVNGAGETETVNGEGNLVIGYDEAPGTQTGSHDLVLGRAQTYSSYGSIVAGVENTAAGAFSSVTGGAQNKAEASWASITGGKDNDVPSTGFWASITGGLENLANSEDSAVTGGKHNQAENFAAAVTGGLANTASGFYTSVSGGADNLSSAELGWIGGGILNTAEAKLASIFGGVELTAGKEYEAIP